MIKKYFSFEVEKRQPKITFTVELERKMRGYVFSVVGPNGQDVDQYSHLIQHPVYNEIVEFWEKYHLNDMNAGTIEQENCLKQYIKDNNITTYPDYNKQLEILEENNLKVVKLPNGEDYTYGTAWLFRPIPEDDLNRIRRLLCFEASSITFYK